MRIYHSAVIQASIFFALLAADARHVAAQVFVPGSGKRVAEVGDDFEDPKWNYIANLPKSSMENDHQARLPGGISANGRWYEPELRGTRMSSSASIRLPTAFRAARDR